MLLEPRLFYVNKFHSLNEYTTNEQLYHIYKHGYPQTELSARCMYILRKAVSFFSSWNIT